MTNLSVALAVLALTHWLPAAPRLRPALVAAIGRRGYHGAYSLVSIAVLTWLIAAYAAAVDSPWLWTPPPWAPQAAVFGMPVALWLVLARLLEHPQDQPQGIYRITATPGSLGLLIWATLHLLNMGQMRSVALFGTFAVMALAAAAKNLLTAPPARRQVGILPGLGALSGRTPISRTDVHWTSAVIALGLWGTLLVLHPLVIGPDPLALALD